MEQTTTFSANELAAAQIVSNNLVRLLRTHATINTISGLAERAELSRATLTRIIKMQSGVTLASLEPLAAALGVEAWMLLYPNLDPRRLPTFGDVPHGPDPIPTDAAWLFSDDAKQWIGQAPGAKTGES